MKPNKEDISITQDELGFHINFKKRSFFFFYKWIPLTYQEAENSEEKPVVFNSLEEAINFIDNIT